MRRIALVLAFCILVGFSLVSCTSPSELYGAWYVDEGDTRNAIQFSENIDGKDVFVWAVYNIKEDKIETTYRGYYKISGDQLIFQYGENADPLKLKFSLDGDKLSVSSDTVVMTLTKYVLDE